MSYNTSEVPVYYKHDISYNLDNGIDIPYLDCDWFKGRINNKYQKPIKSGLSIYYQYKITVSDLFIEIYETFQIKDQSIKLLSLDSVEKYLFLIDIFLYRDLSSDFFIKTSTKFKPLRDNAFKYEFSQLSQWSKGKFSGKDSLLLKIIKKTLTKNHCFIFIDKLGNEIAFLNRDQAISKHRNEILSMLEIS